MIRILTPMRVLLAAVVLLGASAEARAGSAAAPLDAAEVSRLVRTAETTTSDEVRATVLEDLSARAGLDGIPEILELARRSWDCRRKSWAAVTSILARNDDADSYAELASRLGTLSHESRARLLSCAADTGSPLARAFLARRLGSDPDLDAVIVSGLERLPGSADDPEVLEGLRRLLGSNRPMLRRDAARALGRFGDVESLPTLAALLDDETQAVTKEAHWALTTVTGVELPADPARWRAWVEAETRFWREEAEACFASLDSDDPAEVIRAIGILALHPLHRDRTRDALEGMLDHPSGSVRNAARAALSNGSGGPSLSGLGGASGGAGTISTPSPTIGFHATRPGSARAAARGRDAEAEARGSSTRTMLLIGSFIALLLFLRVSGRLSPDRLRALFSRGR